MKIGKKFDFEASHKLPNDEIYGKCSNLHGHRYELIVEVEGEIDEYGWVCNFTELKQIINDEIIDKFDHSMINDFIEIPTVENILMVMANILINKFDQKTYRLSKLVLYETRTSYAELDF